MKQILMPLCIMFLCSFNNKYANHVDVPNVIQKNFEYTFGNNTDVKWSEANGLYKASFTIGSERIIQYYNEDGDVVAVAQYLTISKLPDLLQSALLQFYSGYKVDEVFQISDDLGSYYYVSLSNADSIVLLRSSFNTWKLFSKTAKK